jgi:hypothetical protein
MEKRHDDLLTARIEELAAKGWSFIHWWEAYLWSGQKKLGKNFWRDLDARFASACAKRMPPDLYIYESSAGVLLIHGDELKLISTKFPNDGVD